MTSPAPLINFQSASFEALYAEYQAAHEATKDAWMLEAKAAKALQDSKTWQSKAASWEAFCKDFMPYAASTYRTHLSSVPIAELAEALTGASLLEGQARKLSASLKAVCEDASLMAETYQNASALTNKAVPSQGELQAVYDVLHRAKRQGVVEVNGVDVSMDTAIQGAIAQELYEIAQRKTSHIHASKGTKPCSLELSQKEAVIGFLAGLGVTVADSAKGFKLYWSEDVQP